MSFKNVTPTSEQLQALREEMLKELESARNACTDDNKNLTFDNGFLCGIQSATLEVIAKFAEPILDINNHDGLIKATATLLEHTEKMHHAAHDLIGDPIECPGLTLLHKELAYAVTKRTEVQIKRTEQIAKKIVDTLWPEEAPTDPQKVN